METPGDRPLPLVEKGGKPIQELAGLTP